MPKPKWNLNTIYISERLQESLRPISRCVMTTVVAPMGYGKTTALLILSPARMERILAVSEATGGKLALNLNTDEKLYIAVHGGHGFFDIMKGKESPTELRARFAREIQWFTDTIDAFLIS